MLDFLDGVEDFVINANRTGELFATVDDAVADGGNLCYFIDDTIFAVGQDLDDQVNCNPVVGTFIFFPVGFPAGNFVNNKRVANGDTFNHPLGDDFLFLPVIQLVFYR